jgi:hypothetical protein
MFARALERRVVVWQAAGKQPKQARDATANVPVTATA